MRQALRLALGASFALYGLSIFSSMAGMEIFGWLSATLALVEILFFKQPFVKPNPGDWALIALIGIVTVGAIFNTPEPKSTLDIVGSMRFVPLFLLLRSGLLILWNEKRLQHWAYILSVAAGLIGLYGVSQYWMGWDWVRGHTHRAVQIFMSDPSGVPLRFRAAGLLSSPMTYAYSAGLFACFPAAWMAVTGEFRAKGRTLMGFCAVAIVASIIASMTRGAWLGLGLAYVVMAAYMGRRYLLGILVVGGLFVGLSYIGSETVRTRLSSMASLQSKSSQDRQLIWQANLSMFKDYPLLGVGYGENERLIGDYYRRLGIDGQVGHAHNTYIQFLAGTGLIGLALYLFFIGFYFVLCHRLWWRLPEKWPFYKAMILGAIGAQVVLHVGGLTECNFKDAEVTHEFMFILAVVGVIHYLFMKEAYGALDAQSNPARN